MCCNTRGAIVALRRIQPTSFEDDVGDTGHVVPECIAVTALAWLHSITQLCTTALTDA